MLSQALTHRVTWPMVAQLLAGVLESRGEMCTDGTSASTSTGVVSWYPYRPSLKAELIIPLQTDLQIDTLQPLSE